LYDKNSNSQLPIAHLLLDTTVLQQNLEISRYFFGKFGDWGNFNSGHWKLVEYCNKTKPVFPTILLAWLFYCGRILEAQVVANEIQSGCNVRISRKQSEGLFKRALVLLLPFMMFAMLLSAGGEEPSRESDFVNSIGMKFVKISAGSFSMGKRKELKNGVRIKVSDESPQHTVNLPRSFYIGMYEVTQEEYKKVAGVNPSSFSGTNLPVECVSWYDAIAFCKKLSANDPIYTYRLPTLHGES